jgi:hypothetical protein
MLKKIRIYSDESRHKNERFLLLGGLWVEEKNIKEIERKIKELRSKSGYVNNKGEKIDFLGEFKWTKVSEKYLEVYREYVNLFFDFIEKDLVRFCVMLVDTQNPIVIDYSNIKKEGYFKLLYQLYFHNSKIPAIYKIYPDRITNPTQDAVDFNDLNNCLDRGFWNKFSPMINPVDLPREKGFVNNITSVNSKKCEFIQLVDVVMGGIGYFQNRHFQNPKARKAKKKLMKHIMDKMIYSGAIKISGGKYLVARSTKFNIWLFRPRNKKDPCNS